MDLISAERYNNAGVHAVQVKNDIWVIVKDIGNGLGVKNISDLYIWQMWKKKINNKRRNYML